MDYNSLGPNPASQSLLSATLAPGILAGNKNSNEYLASLDSDTRDYVMKHTGSDRTIMDIVRCVERLHDKG